MTASRAKAPRVTPSQVTPSQVTEISLRRPDDWHLHVRDGESLRAVIGFTAERFGRAIIMPNLKPPVTTTDLAAAYRRAHEFYLAERK